MAEYAGAFFGVEARLLDPIPLPESAHVFPRDQHRSPDLLAHLAARAPADALVYLGISDRDLFAPGKKFVFGEASLESRTGLCSLARLEDSDRRALKLMTHEAGHILSIAHCTACGASCRAPTRSRKATAIRCTSARTTSGNSRGTRVSIRCHATGLSRHCIPGGTGGRTHGGPRNERRKKGLYSARDRRDNLGARARTWLGGEVY
jgi:hypothetical protein